MNKITLSFEKNDIKSKILISSIFSSNLFGNKIYSESDDYENDNENEFTVLSRYKREFNDSTILNYFEIIHFIGCMFTLMEELYKLGYTIYSISLQDILQINNVFIIKNPSRLIKIKNDYIYFTVPFQKNNLYLSPEILNINSLPSSIYYKSVYYSFGLLFMKLYLGSILLEDLKKIEGSKLYYCISRCLDKDYNKRRLLLI
jgi:hypothetical protein